MAALPRKSLQARRDSSPFSPLTDDFLFAVTEKHGEYC